jgi:metal-responsive CopG/Arc/MetJ family transcriptional regulator
VKDIVSISIEKEQLEAVDAHPLKKDIGRSGVVRVVISQFLAKEKSGKEKSKNEKGEK